MTLELDDEEQALLAEVLWREISELGPEIHHTDSKEYRDDLKSRRRTLQKLLDRLGQPQVR